MATKVAHLNVDPDLKKALSDVAADLAALRTPTAAAVADLGALRTPMVDDIADLAAVITAVNALREDHNTLIAKLNLDAGVTDTNYAASTASVVAATAVAPGALTASTPAALATSNT